MRFLLCLFLVAACPAFSQTVMADRTIRANTLILDADVSLRAERISGGFVRKSDVVGQESRVVLYPDRLIRAQDIGPPALITRNQIVRITFQTNGLQITTEGRALERGAEGDRIRAMNLTSRAVLFADVMADGSLKVRQ